MSKADTETTLIEGLGFLRGFLDMLYNTINADDGLENMDEGGFLSITIVAREKLATIEAAFKRLNA